MIATQIELSEFHRFALQRLSERQAGSLQELLDEWNALRQHERSVARIRESIKQADANLSLPLSEAFREVRGKLGFEE